MARSGSLFTVVVLFVCSGFAQAGISPIADFIQNRPYQELSTDNPIGGITAIEIDKASGIMPSVCDGLVAWADGRSGRAVIVGFDLTKWPVDNEFLISDEDDDWQEGNPSVGFNTFEGSRWVVYDAVNVSATGDDGDIQGSLPGTTWLVQQAGKQLCPVSTNVSYQQTYLAWIDYPGTTPLFVGYDNTDIYTAPVTGSRPLTGLTNITSGNSAPRSSLAADGVHLVWQELQFDEDVDPDNPFWNVVVYDLTGASPPFSINIPLADVGKNQIDPDISGNLVVWTQEEDPGVGGSGDTNIYFQDLDSGIGPVAITTMGTAAKAAISKIMLGEGEGRLEASEEMMETCFVVWQDYREDDTQSFFVGGNGEWDYNWDIWGQELRVDGSTGEWDLYEDPFLIRGDSGRQTNPDIDGLDVVWQSQQDYNSEDIYVWGAPIPEPCTLLAAAAGLPLLLARRRRIGRQKRQTK